MVHMGKTRTTKHKLGTIGGTPTMGWRARLLAQKCGCALATPRHVICLHCKSTTQEAPSFLERMAIAIKNIQAALKWQPPKRMKIQHTKPETPLKCRTTKITIEALNAIRTRQVGKTEQDRLWESLERLLAGDLSQPIAISQNCPEWASRKLEREVANAISSLLEIVAEIVDTRERRGIKHRAMRKTSLEDRQKTLGEERNINKRQTNCLENVIHRAQHNLQTKLTTRKTKRREAQKQLEDAERRAKANYRQTRTMTKSLLKETSPIDNTDSLISDRPEQTTTKHINKQQHKEATQENDKHTDTIINEVSHKPENVQQDTETNKQEINEQKQRPQRKPPLFHELADPSRWRTQPDGSVHFKLKNTI